MVEREEKVTGENKILKSFVWGLLQVTQSLWI